MAVSSDVNIGDVILASDINNVRQDAIHATLSHGHSGAANDAKKIIEADITFNVSTGHDHDGVDSKEISISYPDIFAEGLLMTRFDFVPSTLDVSGGDGTEFTNMIRLRSGSANGNYAIIFGDGTGGAPEDIFEDVFDDDWSFTTSTVLTDSNAQDVWWGLCSGTMDDAANGFVNGVCVEEHVAFAVDDNTIYASVANGTTQSRSSLSGITVTQFNQYRVDYTATTNALFYVDEVLKATLSTNLPTATTGGNFSWGTVAREANQKTIYFHKDIAFLDTSYF